MVEVCEPKDRGSIGAHYVAHAASAAGYKIDVLPETASGYDIELLSVHHCSDFPRLAKMPKRARFRLVGGHPAQNNPRPMIPYADAVCVGEGESWIVEALSLIKKHGNIEALRDLKGTIVSSLWRKNDNVPPMRAENPLPDNPPYLNYDGTKSKAWYIEIARGCPFSCHYCELGNSSPYRRYGKERIMRAIDAADMRLARKINFFAPDEASHPDYNELYDYASSRGFNSGFGSMRIDTAMSNKVKVKPNMLIRVGVDGMSEETRFRVNKRITDKMLFDYFRVMTEAGHVNFKMFMVFGYPWEKLTDFDAFDRITRAILTSPLRKNCALRIKWTPFIPQPCTPLADTIPIYNQLMVDRIQRWHLINRHPQRTPGWHVENDGIMGAFSHKTQCQLTSGDEDILSKLYNTTPLWRIK